MVQVRAGAATDVGRLRAENQDALLAGRSLWLVADGMGGQAAGADASAFAVEEFKAVDEAAGSALSVEAIVAGVHRANERLLSEGRLDRERYGLGTTVTGLAAIGDDRWAVFNVGDSRTYHWAEGRLQQITIDHSAVQELVDAGLLDPADALHHPRRNIVTRSLGTRPGPEPDVWERPVAPGERFVICSDGLTNELIDAEIAQVLRDVADPQAAAEQLVTRAVAAGGRDNVTVIVLAVEDRGEDRAED